MLIKFYSSEEAAETIFTRSLILWALDATVASRCCPKAEEPYYNQHCLWTKQMTILI